MTDFADFFTGFIACIVLAIVGRGLMGVTSAHRDTLPFQHRLFTMALLVRFASSVGLYQFGFASVIGDSDAIGWNYGIILQRQWDADFANLFDLPALWLGAFQGNHLGYYYLLGTVSFVTRIESRMVAATLNGFFGALAVVFAYRAARTLFSEWVAARVGWWVCLFPSMILWSAQTIKEPVVILLEVIALYGCTRLKKLGFNFRHVALCAVSIVLIASFRFYAAYIVAAGVGMALLAPDLRRGKLAVGSVVGFVSLLGMLVVFTGAFAATEARVTAFDLEFIHNFRQEIAAGSGSGVVFDVDVRTPSGLSLATLVGAAHLLLAPFPWQLGSGSLRMLLTLPELMYWWWLVFVGVIPGVRYAVRHRFYDTQLLLLFIIGLGLLYSMTFGNVGVVFRQRAQLLPWLFIFAAVGLEQRAQRRAQKQDRLPARLTALQFQSVPSPARERG